MHPVMLEKLVAVQQAELVREAKAQALIHQARQADPRIRPNLFLVSPWGSLKQSIGQVQCWWNSTALFGRRPVQC